VEASLPIGQRGLKIKQMKQKLQTTHNGQGGGKPTIIGQRGLKNKNEIIIIKWPHYLVL
jgi:hypothetical protein